MAELLTETAGTATRLVPAKARLGLIIPAVNSLSEPQFHHYAPPGLGIHVARLRMSGRWKKPFAALGEDIAAAAALLADVRADLIVLHCTGTAMQQGPEAEARIIALIEEATGIPALATGRAICQALDALGLSRLVLVTPYGAETNAHESAYLAAAGIAVVHDVALGLAGGEAYTEVPPADWVEIARANDRAESQGFLLSCTNTRQIEAIAALEAATGKPVVSSNQAVLWAATRTLAGPLGRARPAPGLGRLVQQLRA